MADSSVRVRFSTEYEQLRVTETAFAVPSKLGRRGLSEIVNHLLGEAGGERAAAVDFDFVINDVLLRSSLRRFLELSRLSSEEVLFVRYMPALHLSEEAASRELPAWVGALSTALPSVAVVGCYDGQLQVVDAASLTPLAAVQAHGRGVRAVACVALQTDALVFSAGKDHAVRCFSLAQGKKSKASLAPLAQLQGHGSSVESLAVASGGETLFSGDWAGNIFGWNVGALLGESNAEEEQEEGARKKKRTAHGAVSVRDVKPAFSLRGHGQSVSCMEAQGGALYSASWDHSVREWDVGRQECVGSFAGAKVVTSLHKGGASSLLTSHADGRIRLWDMRERDSGVHALCFGAEGRAWASQVRRHPSSDAHFASADYDGALSLWDMRSSLPVAVRAAHQGKALCVDWTRGATLDCALLSGGSDCLLAATQLSGPSAALRGEQ